ncbi:DUF1580 domain-containing protein [Planctomicrobium sp. SH664]|uniref:DUF1580 domain-containing protein n=1 Tax=Planctomicrobium sp. SH664 TaxID=3448125 RepID=UPI003F5BD2B1
MSTLAKKTRQSRNRDCNAITASAIDNGLRLVAVNELCLRVLGKRVSPATLWRWIKKGVRGGHLDAVQIAGRWCCSVQAFADFINRQTAANLSGEPDSERNCSDSDDALRAAGLL